MRPKNHIFHSEGFTRRVKVVPRVSLREKGAHWYNFQTCLPTKVVDDLGGYGDRMPVVVCKVRCQRHKHKIIVWPNGRITLAAHSGKRAVQAAKVAEALGQTVRCFEVMKLWQHAISTPYDSADAKKQLPKELQALVKPIHKLVAGRGANHRNVVQRSPLATQISSRRRGLIYALIQSSRNSWVQRRELESILVNSGSYQQQDQIQSSINVGDWGKMMLKAGIAQSNLEFEGKKYFPISIPPNVSERGVGWCLCQGGDARYWLWIERVAAKKWTVVRVRKET